MNMHPMSSSIRMNGNYSIQSPLSPSPDDHETEQMDDSNVNETDYHQMQSQYAKWALKAKDKLKAKLTNNLEARKTQIEDAVNNATLRIINDNIVPVISRPSEFKVSSTIASGALERMYHIIESWGGVDIAQCEKLPKDWKRYWRLADNWWNRQKGKWFGDLLFWPVLQYNLNTQCQKVLINKHNEYHYHAIYFIFFCDIMHSEVSFKKSRPVALIFDLALAKSANLTQWLKSTGNRHGLPWDPSKKQHGQSNIKYARQWSKLLRDSLYNQYVRCESQLDNDQLTNDNDISITDSESKSNDNDHDQDIIYPLGQNRALPEPVKPRDPPHPHCRSHSHAYSVYSGQPQSNLARLPPNYQFQSQSQRAPSVSIPTPINQFLPRPRRRGQLFYLLEMKENKPLTQQQLDALSQHSYISTHISVDDTSSTTFNGNQPSTPSTTPVTPSISSNPSLPGSMSIGPYNSFSNISSNKPALKIYDNNNRNQYQAPPHGYAQFKIPIPTSSRNNASNGKRMSILSNMSNISNMSNNPSYNNCTSNKYDRNNPITNGLGPMSIGSGFPAQSNAMTPIHQNNNQNMTLSAQCDIIGTVEDNYPFINRTNTNSHQSFNTNTNANTNTNTNTNASSYHSSSLSPSNLPPRIEIDEAPPQQQVNTCNNGMVWNMNEESYPNNMSISNSFVE
eukprot:CAMPEP_0201593986 /NCGR_PEP_ID=MMETSP0190_2-20130828/191440_1 /ASSEMBLY_ACC=CAM_ASM_000263 /TAXON_ID=37353 /ORGANISM="Rosalina sp." /LENGTH=676 /DNA_ID=CAMNT_0048053425 /DNA_START=71 /DNA_END=2101 /DNA_ORIENTATION=-